MPDTERTVYVNIYDDLNGASGSAHSTREVADLWRKGRVACVTVTFKRGEGLHEDELRGIKW